MRSGVCLGGVSGTGKTADQCGMVIEFASCWYAIRPDRVILEGSGLRLAKIEWCRSNGAFPGEENKNFVQLPVDQLRLAHDRAKTGASDGETG